jgi:flagellar biosynthesis protein FliP
MKKKISGFQKFLGFKQDDSYMVNYFRASFPIAMILFIGSFLILDFLLPENPGKGPMANYIILFVLLIYFTVVIIFGLLKDKEDLGKMPIGKMRKYLAIVFTAFIWAIIFLLITSILGIKIYFH